MSGEVENERYRGDQCAVPRDIAKMTDPVEDRMCAVINPGDVEPLLSLAERNDSLKFPCYTTRLLRWCLILDRTTIKVALQAVARLNRMGIDRNATRLLKTAVSVYPDAPNIVDATVISLIEGHDSKGAIRVLSDSTKAADRRNNIDASNRFSLAQRCVSEIITLVEDKLEDQLFNAVHAIRDRLEPGVDTIATCPVFPNGTMIDVVGTLGTEQRLLGAIRHLNPTSSVTPVELGDGPSQDDAILTSLTAPGPDAARWTRRMRVGWGEPLESWTCLAAGISQDGGFEIDLLLKYMTSRMKRIIGTYPAYCEPGLRNENAASVYRVAERLSDERSRQLYYGTFTLSPDRNWRDYLSGLVLHQHYADYIDFAQVSTVLNLGVYSGTELCFLDAVVPPHGKLICVDPFGPDKLPEFIASMVQRNDKIQFVRAAAAGQLGVLNFRNQGPATSSTEFEGVDMFSVPAMTIGEILQKESCSNSPLMIKTDIEGAEIEILDDMVALAQRRRAVLAVSIYHTPEQYTEIPERLMDCLEDYRFHFNRYSPHAGEGVLYAVPNEHVEVDFCNPYKLTESRGIG